MTPLRIALIYLILSLVWILFSDQLLHFLVDDGALLRRLQTLKGWAFVTVTSLIIYLLSRALQSALLRELAAKRRHLTQLRYKAYTDYQTGLPNRRMGLKILRRLLREREHSQQPFGILYLDLDNFKQINDSLGHNVGDRVIADVAQRLEGLLNKDQQLVRQNGDEFLLIIEQVPSAETLAACAQSVIDAFNEPLDIDALSLRVTPSIGVVCFPEDGTSVLQLMRCADLALHHSKKYRNCYKRFDSSMSNTLQYRFELEQKLRQAVAARALAIYYQPIYNPETRTFVGAEALLRWRDGERFISPAEFIPVAEHSGLIRQLGAMVLEEACRLTRALSAELGRELSISINVSPKQFANCHILADMTQALARSGIAPECVNLEITEGVFLSNIAETAEVLNQLAAMGVNLSMDDFGQGYSSLSYLRQHPFKILKIDQMFVQGMQDSRQDLGLVQASIGMARALRLKVVAEGVETPEQLATLTALGVDYVQGYLLARPLPEAEFLAFMKSRSQVVSQA